MSTSLDNLGELQIVGDAGISCDIPRPRAPKSPESFTPESLEVEFQRIAAKMIQFKFHEELGMTPEEYIASLPHFEMPSKEVVEQFDTPVIVDSRISPRRQAELLGIQYDLNDEDLQDYETGDKAIVADKIPYTVWMNDGSGQINTSILSMRYTVIPMNKEAVRLGKLEWFQKYREENKLKKAVPMRAANIFDGLGLYIAHPEVLDHHMVDLSGTLIKNQEGAPTIKLHENGTVSIARRFIESYACSQIGQASCAA